MGSIFNSFRKDDKVDIYLQLGSSLYMAGSMIEGNVYLNVKAFI